MRSLSPDEAEAWAKVTATIRPLSRDRIEPDQTIEVSAEEPPPRPRKPAAVPAPKPKPSRRPEPGTTLDGTWDRRLRSGSIQPDRVLDLHGMTLDVAWTAIDLALEQSEARGDRVLLLITGHHRPGATPVQRGKIRAAIHDWLAVSRHAGAIAAVRGAHPRHGGGGSLYIVLRRR
ncbi:Smr/MutS family protein [Sphingomonas sp.]|uniref:Smr/MutS family protein n=1 Tax=Sphingomonas sp. TaxID=28214 RepID=UPI0025ECD628|nr:Smr/MutS family protein [Sphingomonas sp.]MBV9528019.1 Smr/MutS family protein [Sphingomonas sp.]